MQVAEIRRLTQNQLQQVFNTIGVMDWVPSNDDWACFVD